MTRKMLEKKIAATMKSLKADDVKKSAKKAYGDYEDELKNEICKEKGVDKWTDVPADDREAALEKWGDRYPMENYLYIMFNDEGDLDGWTIDHNQYFQGHSGPTSAISIHAGGVDYDDIRREIGNDLFEAIETD